MYDLNNVTPEPDLGVALEQPRARLDAVLGADLELQVIAHDERPVRGLPVPDVDRGRLVSVTVKSDGENLTLVARDIFRINVDVTLEGLGKFGRESVVS